MIRFYWIGQIVLSFNVIMEIEILVMFCVWEMILFECFIFYFVWMCMKKVMVEELVVMDVDFDCCVFELLDVDVDVFGYVCFVVIMSMGNGYY